MISHNSKIGEWRRIVKDDGGQGRSLGKLYVEHLQGMRPRMVEARYSMTFYIHQEEDHGVKSSTQRIEYHVSFTKLFPETIVTFLRICVQSNIQLQG